MIQRFAMGLVLFSSVLSAEDAAPVTLWHHDFETVPVGEVPKGCLILEGDFGVQMHRDGRVLRLKPGSQILSGMLAGPARQSPIEMTATVYGAKQKRLAPQFGVGLHGDTGWKLMAAPGRDQLELWHDRKPVITCDMKFESDLRWRFRLASIALSKQNWIILGKCWPENHAESEQWQLKHALEQAPMAGRAGLWAAPYAGQPVDFDDVRIRTIRVEDLDSLRPMIHLLENTL